MSQELQTVDGSVIVSEAFDGMYKLSVLEGNRLKKRSWPYKKYKELIADLWYSYLSMKKRPGILGHELTDNAFVTETLHFIAPAAFHDPDSGPLNEFREGLTYWLKNNISSIREIIGDEEAGSLERGLEYILKEHSERLGKKKKAS